MNARVIGGGFAGAEAAYQLAIRGVNVELYEMRPVVTTPVHRTAGLAEPVCSNSLKSEDPASAQGELKRELKMLGSAVLRAAERSRVPAGGALAVDRTAFSENVEKILLSTCRVTVIREEVTEITPNTIIATGPLTSEKLAAAIEKMSGKERLYFFDAAAPIVTGESVDREKAFFAARYDKGDADYLNCPMNAEEYRAFRLALMSARKAILRDFEKGELFENCMPIEELARRGEDAMRFGPLRPVGIRSANGERHYAVVQLRKEDLYDGAYNIVGFQTNLAFPEQERVFRMIPGLEKAEFVRYGVMHRNTYLHSPGFLRSDYSVIGAENVFFAGQITGTEGYLESAASGLVAGINLFRRMKGGETLTLPAETVTGSMQRYISEYAGNFQPMHVSFALTPPLSVRIRGKAERKAAYATRAAAALETYIKQKGVTI